MHVFKLMTFATLLILSANLFAYGVGNSSYPLEVKKNRLSAGFNGIVKNGSGAGIVGRFTRKLNPMITMDAGAELNSGERSSAFFVGSDFEIFPDYDKQPRFSIKSSLARLSEYESTMMVIGATPIVSKGMSFWGKEGYTYLAIPLGLGLKIDDKRYHTRMSAALGVNGPIPFKGYEKFIGQLEAKVNLKNTYSGIYLGFSYPLD